MSTDQHLDVSERDDMTIVRFKGCRLLVDALVVNGVGRELGDLASGQDCRTLIVDFAGVEDVSSAVLGLLVMLRKKMAFKKGQLVLCGLSPEVREFCDETMLSQLFEIRETEADAFVALV